MNPKSQEESSKNQTYGSNIEQKINIKNIQQSKLFQKFKENTGTSAKPAPLKNDTSKTNHLTSKNKEVQNPRQQQKDFREDYYLDNTESFEKNSHDNYNSNEHQTGFSDENNTRDLDNGKEASYANHQGQYAGNDDNVFTKGNNHDPNSFQKNKHQSQSFNFASLDSQQPDLNFKAGQNNDYSRSSSQVYDQGSLNNTSTMLSQHLPQFQRNISYEHFNNPNLSNFNSPINRQSVQDMETMNLNLNATSNYFPFYQNPHYSQQHQQTNQFSSPNSFMPFPFIMPPFVTQQSMELPQNRESNNGSIKFAAPENSDVFFLRSKLNEVTQALDREVENSKVKC